MYLQSVVVKEQSCDLHERWEFYLLFAQTAKMLHSLAHGIALHIFIPCYNNTGKALMSFRQRQLLMNGPTHIDIHLH